MSQGVWRFEVHLVNNGKVKARELPNQQSFGGYGRAYEIWLKHDKDIRITCPSNILGMGRRENDRKESEIEIKEY